MDRSPAVKRVRKRATDFHHGDLKAAAVEVAIREVEKRGHVDLTLDHVAAKLGVTRPALYRHFADKRALLVEVAQRGYERFEAAVSAAFFAHPDDVWAGLEALGIAYVEFSVANPGWFRLQFAHPVPHPDLERSPARYQPAMHAALDRALGIPDGPAAYVTLWGTAHGLAALVVEGLPLPYKESIGVQVRALAAYAKRR